MDYEFIAHIETWGSGGQMLEVITLKDGRILLLREGAVVLFPNRASFDSGRNGRRIDTEPREVVIAAAADRSHRSEHRAGRAGLLRSIQTKPRIH